MGGINYQQWVVYDIAIPTLLYLTGCLFHSRSPPQHCAKSCRLQTAYILVDGSCVSSPHMGDDDDDDDDDDDGDQSRQQTLSGTG